MKLGDVVKKYESGSLGPKSISTGKGDPGGVSYGTYQLASKTGTLTRFLKYSGYDKNFINLLPGTPKFNETWLHLANTDEFNDAQHEFIASTHYKPVRKLADVLALPDHPAVNEAIWSMSIQHGKASLIVTNAVNYIDKKDPVTVVQALYKARCMYVDKLNMGYLKKRYSQELQDVLKLCQ